MVANITKLDVMRAASIFLCLTKTRVIAGTSPFSIIAFAQNYEIR